MTPGPGIVYTETVVHSPTPQFAADVPYQLAIVSLVDGRRLTARIEGERAAMFLFEEAANNLNDDGGGADTGGTNRMVREYRTDSRSTVCPTSSSGCADRFTIRSWTTSCFRWDNQWSL